MITYEEAYRRYKNIIEGYCKFQVGNQYYAEEATSETFNVLYEKWHSLNSHESKVILTWLYRTANNKIKELSRTQPPEYVNIDDENSQNLIEKRLMEDHSIPNEYDECVKYEKYIVQIKQILKKKESDLFDYIVVKKLNYRQVSKHLKISESAVKMRWYRLQNKLVPLVKNLIKKNL